MPREMFSELSDPSAKLGTKQWYTVPVSILVHTVLIAALVVIPLLASDILPTPQSVMAFVAVPPSPPPPPPPPPPPAAPQPETPQVDINPEAAPIEAPPEVKPEPPPRPVAGRFGVVGGVAGGIPGGSVGGVAGGIAAPPPPPQEPIRVGGKIKPPTKIHNVDPIYPPIAQSARVSGVVIIEATIGVDGSVTDARVIRPVALLDQAALEAVRQWKFTPTLLNGTAVPVIMTVTVNFTLR